MAETAVAQRQWEVENSVHAVADDELFAADVKGQQAILQSAPWKTE